MIDGSMSILNSLMQQQAVLNCSLQMQILLAQSQTQCILDPPVDDWRLKIPDVCCTDMRPVPSRTNCCNCGAPLGYHFRCDYCGTVNQ